MAKYNDKAMKTMAEILRGAKEAGNVRYMFFVQTVAMISGTTVEYVEQMVEYYANMKTETENE